MTEDSDIWEPLSIDEVVDLMSQVTIPWWIAGGLAIDLFSGQHPLPVCIRDMMRKGR